MATTVASGIVERRYSEPYPSPDPASNTIDPPDRMLGGCWLTDEDTVAEETAAEAHR